MNRLATDLPSVWRSAAVTGRLWLADVAIPVVVVGGQVRDVSRHAATVSIC